MILGVIVQQPDDVLDYDIGYEKWFDGQGDTIQSVITNIVPPDGTLNVNSQISGDDVIKLWIQGGTDGEQYTVEITPVMASGRTKQNELIVQIKDYK